MAGTLGTAGSLSTGDVAVALGCSRNTVHRLADSGDLLALRLTARSPRRIAAGVLLDFVAERIRASAPAKEDS